MIERFLRRVQSFRRSATESPHARDSVLPSVPISAVPFVEDLLPEQFPEIADIGLRRVLTRMDEFCDMEIYDWPIRVKEFTDELVPRHELGWRRVKAQDTVQYFVHHHMVETSTGPLWYTGQRAYWLVKDQILAATALYYFRENGVVLRKVVDATKQGLGISPLASKIYNGDAPIVPYQETEVQNDDPDFLLFMGDAREVLQGRTSQPLFKQELADIISDLCGVTSVRRGILFTNHHYDPVRIQHQLERYTNLGVLILSKTDYPDFKGRDGKPLQGDIFAENEALASCALVYAWLRTRSLSPLEETIYKVRRHLKDHSLVSLIHDPQREK